MAASHFSQPAPVPPAGTAESQAPADRDTEFRRVEGGAELRSGEQLLVMAYALIWVLLFGTLLLGLRRQRALEARMATLERALDAAGQRPTGGREGQASGPGES